MNKLAQENYKALKKLLIYQLALSKSYLESYCNGLKYNTYTLYDFRIINLGCVRRSGTTSAVAELFGKADVDVIELFPKYDKHMRRLFKHRITFWV